MAVAHPATAVRLMRYCRTLESSIFVVCEAYKDTYDSHDLLARVSHDASISSLVVDESSPGSGWRKKVSEAGKRSCSEARATFRNSRSRCSSNLRIPIKWCYISNEGSDTSRKYFIPGTDGNAKDRLTFHPTWLYWWQRNNIACGYFHASICKETRGLCRGGVVTTQMSC